MDSPDDKEAVALRLLEESAGEKHSGECVLLRVEMLSRTGILEIIDHALTPRPSAGAIGRRRAGSVVRE
jgi:hypothetical protein